MSSLQRNQDMLNYAAQQASVNAPELFNTDCSMMPVIAYLKDHKAQTLDDVVAIADRFARENSSPDRQFLLAAGSAGIEAATNIVVREANRTMLLFVYLAVTLFCLITFRSWRATLVALLPLVLTSVLCEALMVAMGIGVKVATLPVIALGVGIGVDYALYLLSVQLHYQRQGRTLGEAYQNAVAFTGRVVGLVGITLAAGVVAWAWSPIKFQADMGILLTFMFLWNMLGALLLIPALSHFLLPDKRFVAAAPRIAKPHHSPVTVPRYHARKRGCRRSQLLVDSNMETGTNVMAKTKIMPPAAGAYAYPLLIKRLLMSGVQHQPDQQIIYADTLRYTYRELEQRVRRLANVLRAAGVQAGDTVALLDWDSTVRWNASSPCR